MASAVTRGGGARQSGRAPPHTIDRPRGAENPEPIEQAFEPPHQRIVAPKRVSQISSNFRRREYATRTASQLGGFAPEFAELAFHTGVIRSTTAAVVGFSDGHSP
jgi:hypothetical protein